MDRYRLSTTRTLLSITGIVIFLFIVSSRVLAGSVTQGYRAKTDLPKGAVVSLTKNGAEEVEKTTTDNDSLVAGVVVDAPDSLLDILPQGSEVRVAVNGEVKILVSTLNGDIKSGDKLIPTPLAGISALDYPPAPGVKYIAVASEDFNQSSANAKKTSITLNDNSKKEIYIGLISSRMLLSNRNPGTKDKNILTTLGKQISGKDVSLVQVLAAVSVFVTTVALAGMVLQGSIRGTFISLGRNPLSKDSILTGLVRVVALSIFVLSIGIVVAYVILIL